MQIMLNSAKQTNQAWSNGLRRLLTGLCVGLLISALSGCGFHLRGMDRVGEAAFQSVVLVNLDQVRPDIQRAIRTEMIASGVRVVDSIALAELTIEFKPTVFSARRTGYSRQGDTAAELLRMEQAFEVVDVATEEKVVAGLVKTYRDRQVNPTAMLSSNRELGMIQRDMAEELARQLIDRIHRAVLSRPKK